jgi:tRNA dimethylallyltransferase
LEDKKHILIVGPTASGKTELAHLLGKKLHATIISADSRQSYKFLDIGTAKTSANYLSELEYKNISILDPKEFDNAISFLERFNKWECDTKNSLIVVGGSTLYQQALLFGFDEIPQSNQANIEHLVHEISEFGIEKLFNRLQSIDPVYANKMDGFNTQRIIRALDVYMQTGLPFSTFHKINVTSQPKNWFVIFPKIPIDLLKQRINLRVDQMVSNGLLNEIVHLLEAGYKFSDPGFKSIGYQEWESFFNNSQSLSETIQKIKTNSWHYAKRQLTWLKRWEFVKTYDFKNGLTNELLEIILKDYSAFLLE